MRDAQNWTDAQKYCKTYKQSLATIFSAFHNTMVNTETRKWVNANISWWIGECILSEGTGPTEPNLVVPSQCCTAELNQ